MTKHRNRSFITDSIIFNVISVTIILLIYMGILTLVNYRLEKSFPSLEDMLNYEEKLKQDEYSKIPLKKFNDCSIIIYNEKGKTLYSSNKEVGEEISSEDIELINGYYNDEYYIVHDFIKEKKEKQYYIMKANYNNETGNESIIEYGVLNSNLEIIEGNLFGERKKISEMQFELIKGKYKDYTIEKYQYENTRGESRILVFLSPELKINNYEKALKNANQLWILAFPLVLILFFIEVLLYKRKLNKCMEPLNSIITSYESKSMEEVNSNKISIEFQPIAKKFQQLLKKIDRNKVEKNKLIANISHDLKTPLTAIEGYAQAFKDNIVPKEKKEQYINAMYEKAKLATELINRLFEYTKLEHPEYKIDLVPTNINEFTRKYLANKYTEIEMKEFKLNVKIPEQECMCYLDKELFTRLYDNLISNIFKHNNSGTEILFEILVQNNRIKIIIADNGIGILDEVKENLFEPFITGNKARTSGEGTGLGMTIVKKIIELHNGTIKLNEKPTKGYKTEIVIELAKIQ